MQPLYTGDVSSFAGFQLQCECGHTHTVPIRHIYIGKGILSNLSHILEDFRGKKVFLIGDSNTMPLAEEKVLSILQKAAYHWKLLIKLHLPAVHEKEAIGSFLPVFPRRPA